MEKLLGGDVIARMLKAEGVEKVFGIIDGSYFGLYSSIVRNGIQLISPRHEACAVHMAGAYARTTGKLGVCIASNGPGVANALPGVAVENGEGNRVLLLTSTRRLGTGYPDRGGTYQYFNQVGVIKPMAKWSGVVPSFHRVPEFVKRAFRVSFRGRPGVVHLDIPESILNNKERVISLPRAGTYRRTTPIAPHPQQVQQAVELLLNAQLPIIHAGSGVLHAQASPELQRLAETLQAPVVTSWAARGVIPETSPLSLPMIHIELCNQIRNEADLVLTLGSRIGETDWWGKPPYWANPSAQKHIQVDIDEEILGLNKPTDLPILADAGEFIRGVLAEIDRRGATPSFVERSRAVQRYVDARKKNRAQLDKIFERADYPLTAGHLARACQEVFPADAFCVLDGGNTAVWGNFYHECVTPGAILATFKFGMLGAGVAQALGAKVAHPERFVYCLIGDGAMGFNQQEIETAVRNKLHVVYLVCCDKQWGMVKMNQQFALKPLKTLIMKSLGPDETINADFLEIQFDKLAESMGAHGERVRSLDQLRPALERCLAANVCSVVHVDVDPVKHMWAPNLLTFKKMHEEPKGS
jgi:acetolactate synthase-1/2/3 large subunit